MNLLKGLLEVAGGVVAGLILGALLCWFPSDDQVCLPVLPVTHSVLLSYCLSDCLRVLLPACLSPGGRGGAQGDHAPGSVHLLCVLQPRRGLRWSRRSEHPGPLLPGRSGLEDQQGEAPSGRPDIGRHASHQDCKDLESVFNDCKM